MLRESQIFPMVDDWAASQSERRSEQLRKATERLAQSTDNFCDLLMRWQLPSGRRPNFAYYPGESHPKESSASNPTIPGKSTEAHGLRDSGRTMPFTRCFGSRSNMGPTRAAWCLSCVKRTTVDCRPAQTSKQIAGPAGGRPIASSSDGRRLLGYPARNAALRND